MCAQIAIDIAIGGVELIDSRQVSLGNDLLQSIRSVLARPRLHYAGLPVR